MDAYELPIIVRDLEPALREIDATVSNLSVRLDRGFAVAEWDGRLGRFSSSCAASRDREHLMHTTTLIYADALRLA